MEEEELEQQDFQPTAKVGAKKQKKLEEKQAKKAQREVRETYGTLILSWASECVAAVGKRQNHLTSKAV